MLKTRMDGLQCLLVNMDIMTLSKMDECFRMRLLRFSTTVILGRFSTVARLSEKQAEARVKLKNFDNARQH